MPLEKFSRQLVRLAIVSALFSWSLLCVPAGAISATVVFTGGATASLEVETADTPAMRALGLMFRASLPEGHGVWFVFPDDKARVFWMKNMRFPIDIIFIDKNHVIRKIWDCVPPCKAEPCAVYESGEPARYVLETRAGFSKANRVREGQKVEFRP